MRDGRASNVFRCQRANTGAVGDLTAGVRPKAGSLPSFTRTLALGLLMLIPCAWPAMAEPVSETVSFRCGLAIDAVIAEMDSQAANPVTQEALGRIDESNGEFVCIHSEPSAIYVSLRSSAMSPTENKLVFTVDTGRYRVVKTYYGP